MHVERLAFSAFWLRLREKRRLWRTIQQSTLPTEQCCIYRWNVCKKNGFKQPILILREDHIFSDNREGWERACVENTIRLKAIDLLIVFYTALKLGGVSTLIGDKYIFWSWLITIRVRVTLGIALVAHVWIDHVKVLKKMKSENKIK